MADNIKSISGDVEGSQGTKRISLSAVIPKGKENDNAYLTKLLESEYDKKYGATVSMPQGITAEIPGSRQHVPPSFDTPQQLGSDSPYMSAAKFLASPVTSLASMPGEIAGFVKHGFRNPSYEEGAMPNGAMGENPLSQAYGAGLMALGPPDLATGAEGVARAGRAVVGGAKGLGSAVVAPSFYRSIKGPMLAGTAVGEAGNLLTGGGMHNWGPAAVGGGIGGIIGLSKITPQIIDAVKYGAREANPYGWKNIDPGFAGSEVMDNLNRIEPSPAGAKAPAPQRPPIITPEPGWGPEAVSRYAPPMPRTGVNYATTSPSMSGQQAIGPTQPPIVTPPPPRVFNMPGATLPDVQAPLALPAPGELARSRGAIPLPAGKPPVGPVQPDLATAARPEPVAPSAVPTVQAPEVPKPQTAPQVEPPKTAQDIARAALRSSTEQTPASVEPPAQAKAPQELPQVKAPDFEVRQPQIEVPTDMRNKVLQWMKVRKDVTAPQIMTEFGLPGDTVRSLLADYHKRGLVLGERGKYNYAKMPGEELPEAPSSATAEPNVPDATAPPEVPAASAKPAKLSPRAQRIEDLWQQAKEAETEGDTETAKVLRDHAANEAKTLQLENSKFKTHKEHAKQIDSLSQQIDRLESKDNLTEQEDADLQHLYRQMGEMEKKRDRLLTPDVEKYGPRIANMRDIHSEFSHAEISARAKEEFGVTSTSQLTPDQLTKLRDIMRTEALEREASKNRP